MTAVKLEDARRVISAAEKKAREIGQPMNIAVADEGGNIVAHVRMDNAWIGSIDISMKKAYTSRAFDIETKELAKLSQSGGQFFGIHVSNNGKIMIFAGGIPLKLDGKVVGAIGAAVDPAIRIMPSTGPAPPRSNPAGREHSMSHHYSGPDFSFPQGDARLDFTDLYAFPKPA